MKSKGLEVKEAETMVKKTHFEVKVPTRETRDDKVFKTPFSSNIEG